MVVVPSQSPDTGADEGSLEIFDAAPVALVAVGRDGRIAGWNRQAEKSYGWSRTDAIGMPSATIVPWADREAYGRLLQGWLGSDEVPPQAPHRRRGYTATDMCFPLN